jgi:hypothetical protein
MLYYDTNGEEVWAEVGDFAFDYSVKRRAWLGQYRPAECRGLIDHLASVFVPT